jgi:hypothetical protein
VTFSPKDRRSLNPAVEPLPQWNQGRKLIVPDFNPLRSLLKSLFVQLYNFSLHVNMDPISVIAMVGTVAATINTVAAQVMTIKQLHDQIKAADIHLMSLIAQLNAIKAALTQIQELIQTANYNETLQSDLELSIQACELHMQYLDQKTSKLKTKNAGGALKFRSRVKVVFESDDMEACLGRLNHQATALNLLITVLTSKTVTEQKQMLQRSGTRKIFKQIQEDKASVMDETASMVVHRDAESVRNAAIRTKSEPIISKTPWKRFGFDHQILRSKAYGGKRSSKVEPVKPTLTESVSEADIDSVDEAATLVEEPEESSPSLKVDVSGLSLEPPSKGPVRFSRMLAFDNASGNISTLIAHAQYLWNAQDHKPSQRLSRVSSVHSHRLSTRYFDVSIHVQPITDTNHGQVNDEFLASYRDVSSILFAGSLAAYQHDAMRLENDLALFARTANDYHLWLAKIVLFLDTGDLDPYGAQGISDDVARRFLHAARAGASNDRIHVVAGDADETAAGRIFAVCNETGRVQENKWAGLTKTPTY